MAWMTYKGKRLVRLVTALLCPPSGSGRASGDQDRVVIAKEAFLICYHVMSYDVIERRQRTKEMARPPAPRAGPGTCRTDSSVGPVRRYIGDEEQEKDDAIRMRKKENDKDEEQRDSGNNV
ncbi:unnamed protein product, partial [Pylaiella littoralis]